MKKILIVFVILFSLVLGVTPAMAQTLSQSDAKSTMENYADVSGKWYEKAANTYGYSDIFSDGSGNFSPYKKITCMEFVRLLHKALSIKINYFAATDIGEYFSDVQNSDTGAGELYDLVTAAIIDNRGSFEPDKQLDREDMIHYSIRALDYITGGNYSIIKINPPPFKDDDKIDLNYKLEVYKAVVLKLIYGCGDGMLLPKQGANRAEAVTVAGRLVDLVSSLKGNVDVSASKTEENGTLRLSLTIMNISDKTITINHKSGQKYDFRIFDEKGETLYTWSADKFFIMALTTTEIKAGGKIEFAVTLDSDAYNKLKSKAKSVKAYIVGTSYDFEINAEGYYA